MATSGFKTWRDEKLGFWRRLFRRDAPEAGPVTLGRRRVYILPTRSGLVFALILLAMLIGAVNYQNSLAFVLTFLLTGLAVVSMIHTFRNLHALTLRAGHPQPVFAGETARFSVNLENRGGRERYALNLMLPGQEPLTVDLPQNGGQWLSLPLPSRQRGLLHPGRITLYTRFPLGLFHAWSYVHLDMACLIYPRPAERRGLPPQLPASSGAVGDQGSGSDDFASLRTYHPGDSLRHVHWKAAAREQGLLTKQFGGGISRELWLRWEQTGQLPLEQRLSLLTRWVLEADTLGLAYGLALPEREFAPACGEAHRRRCLGALALYALPGEQR
jgi:uncharacterized protein (DUF58 family)